MTPLDIIPLGPIVRVQTLGVFRNRLFAGQGIGPSEATVWATPSGSGEDWRAVNAEGFGAGLNTSIDAMAASPSHFYVATQDATDGVRTWRKGTILADVLRFDAPLCVRFPDLCERLLGLPE